MNPPPPGPGSPSPADPTHPGEGPVVLLVDDGAEIGLIVRRLARQQAYTVVHHLRAETAWEYLQDTRPALVLLDVNLPGMSGLELARLIRQAPGLADLRVAFLSASVLQDELAEVVDGVLTFMLGKDLLARPPEWQARIRELLGGR